MVAKAVASMRTVTVRNSVHCVYVRRGWSGKEEGEEARR